MSWSAKAGCLWVRSGGRGHESKSEGVTVRAMTRVLEGESEGVRMM